MNIKVAARRRRNEKSPVAIVTATRDSCCSAGSTASPSKRSLRVPGQQADDLLLVHTRRALIADMLLEDADKGPAAVAHTGDLTADRRVGRQSRGHAHYLARLGDAAFLDGLPAGTRRLRHALRTGLSTALQDTVKTRLAAEHIDEPTAQAAADGVVDICPVNVGGPLVGYFVDLVFNTRRRDRAVRARHVGTDTDAVVRAHDR